MIFKKVIDFLKFQNLWIFINKYILEHKIYECFRTNKVKNIPIIFCDMFNIITMSTCRHHLDGNI